MKEVIDFRVRLRTPQMLKPWNPKKPAPHFEQYINFYHMESRLSVLSDEEFVNNMHNQGVSKGVVCAGSPDDNDHLIEKKDSMFGDHYYFIAGLDPKYGIKRNLEELKKCKNKGFLGGNYIP